MTDSLISPKETTIKWITLAGTLLWFAATSLNKTFGSRSEPRQYAMWPIGLMLLVVVGCGKEPTMGELTGTITIDGQPVEKGSIAFFPTDGKSRTTGAKIRQGEYSAQVPFGSAKVEIRVPKVIGKQKLYDLPDSPLEEIVGEALPAKYNNRTELLVDIQPGTNREDFILTGDTKTLPLAQTFPLNRGMRVMYSQLLKMYFASRSPRTPSKARKTKREPFRRLCIEQLEDRQMLFGDGLLPGDFDMDADVDGADFLSWQRNPSVVGSLADWESNFGEVSNSSTAAVNDATFFNETWNGFTGLAQLKNVYAGGNVANDIGWLATSGTSGPAPTVSNGEVVTSMVGATGGNTKLFTVGLDAYSELFPDTYVVTMRVKVEQFPDANITSTTASGKGIVLLDARRDFRLEALVTPTALWISQGSSWTQISVNTAADTYYTWQFEVDDMAGTFDVYRREFDTYAFSKVAGNVALRNQDVVDQFRFLEVKYNGENTQTQGQVVADYFQVGNFTPLDLSRALLEESWDGLTGLASAQDVYAGGDPSHDIGWLATAGTGGAAPTVTGGAVVVSMVGATEGKSQVFTSAIDAALRSEFFFDQYTVTTRVNVDQFPDANIASNSVSGKGISLLDSRRDFRFLATLTSTALWVDDGASWTEISVTTLEDVFYTWKFDVNDADGSVDVYRRASEDDNFEIIATNVSIRNQAVTDQIIFNVVHYNGENTQIQGVIFADYFRVESTPDPILYVSFDNNLNGINSAGTVALTASSGASLIASGVQGGALQLSNSGYVQYSNVFANDSGTVMFWIRPDGNDTTWPSLRYNFFSSYGTDAANSSANERARLFLADFLRFKGYEEDDDPLKMHRFLASAWPKGEWMHLAFSWDQDGGVEMYVNGLPYQHGQSAQSEMLRRGTGNVTLQDIQRIFLGVPPSSVIPVSSAALAFDELKVFDVALTDREVSGEYRRGMPVDLTVQRRYLRAGEAETVNLEISPGGKIATPRVGIAVPVPISIDLNLELTTLAGVPVATQNLSVFVEQETENISINVGSLAEGSYRLKVTFPWQGGVGSRIFALEVYEQNAAPAESNAPLTLGPLLGTIDASQGGQGFVASAPTQVVTVPGLGTYREAGSNKFDRFSYELDFFPGDGEPVVLEITWPDDRPRSMGLYMYRESATLSQNRDRLSGGVQSGVEYPGTGGMVTTRYLFYPWTEKYLFEARTMIPGYSAAIAEIKVYSVSGRLPKLPVYTPAGEEERLFGNMDEDQTFDLLLNGELEQKGPGQKRYVIDVIERLLDYLDYTGQNTLSYPLVRYNYVYKDLPGSFDGIGFRTNGWQDLMLDMFERRGKKLIATVNLTGLPEDLLAPDSSSEAYALYDRNGDVSSGNRVNPVHPEARQRVLRHINDVIADVGAHSANAGLKLWFSGKNSPWAFSSLEDGYGDFTVDLFETETGIDLGISDTTSNRFDLRYQALTGTHRTAWLQWRSEKTTALVAQVDAMIQSVNPNLSLYLALGNWGGAETATNQNEENFDFTDLFYESYAMDLNALAALPSVRLSPVRQPSWYRWQRQWDNAESTTNELLWDPDKFTDIRATGRAASWSYQRYYESFQPSLDNTTYKSNFQNSDVKPHGRYFLQELVQSLAATDGQAILIGAQPLGTSGRDDYAREFAQAYRALPAGAFVDVAGTQDPVVVRTLQTAGGTYLYLANLSFFSLDGTVSLTGAPMNATDLSTGNLLAVTGGDLTVNLKPFELRSFRLDSTVAATNWQVNIPTEVTTWMQDKFNQIISMPGSPAGSLPALTSTIQASIDAGELANAHRLITSKMLRTGAIPPYLPLPSGVPITSGQAAFSQVAISELSDQTPDKSGGLFESFVNIAAPYWISQGTGANARAGIDSRVADLSGNLRGFAQRSNVWIDSNAAGNEWFVGPTPWDDIEFGIGTDPEGMELLSVLAHELGHAFGYDHDNLNDAIATLIDSTLGAGERR